MSLRVVLVPEGKLAPMTNVDDDHTFWSDFLIRQNIRQHDEAPRAGHRAARAAPWEIRERLPGNCKPLD